MRVRGDSMGPALRDGQLLVIDRAAYRRRAPQHGEVVAARPASLGGRALVKRLAGLPYEHVVLGAHQWQLGEGQFFLLGDRADRSTDSRAFGPVSHSELLGPVALRLWPPFHF